MAHFWRIELLGTMRARRLDPQQPGTPPGTEWTTQQTRSLEHFSSGVAGALLAFLAYHPGRHSREVLAELLWPGHDPQHSRAHLRVMLSALRRSLEPNDVPNGAVIVADRHTAGLNFENVTCDVAEFEGALQSASRATSPEQQSAYLKRAVDMYGGNLLPGYYEAWIVPEAQRLEELYFAALRRLIVALEGQRQFDLALQYAQRGVIINALREDVQYDVMRLQAASGRPALALQQYREFARVLAEQLNTSPGPRLRELRNRIQDAGEDDSSGGKISERDTNSLATRGGGSITRDSNEYVPRSPDVDWVPAAPSVSYPPHASASAQPEGSARSTPTGIAAHLPPEWKRFFGRRSELGALQNLLSDFSVRLVTLTGPGGSGKTRLALETARLWQEKWEPEIALRFVPLAEVSQPDRLAAAIAEVVSAEALWPGSGPHSALERLVPPLQAGTRPVLVLDNFEHLLPAGSALVQILLQQVPALRILVTSRHPLGLAAETVFAVPLMPVPLLDTPPEKLMEWESVQLFYDRARQVRPDFKISKRNASAIARLCNRLEGWPLSIEFCAAQAGKLAPWQMLHRLEHRLDFLATTPGNDLPERHSTLRVMLNWSYELLWPELRRFFAGLSIFRGGGTPEAVAIVTDQSHAVHYLDQLQAASLIRLGADGRFFLLETVREFAREQLREHEEAELQRRHANCFLEIVQAALPDLQATASHRRLGRLQRLKIEHDNFRTAMEWSLEHDPVMALQFVDATSYFWADLFADAHSLAEQALEKAAHRAPPLLVSSVLTIAANGAGRRGDYRRQSELARQRLELACQIDDELQVAWAWFHVGSSAFATGEHVAAERAFLQALQLFQARVAQILVPDQTVSSGQALDISQALDINQALDTEQYSSSRQALDTNQACELQNVAWTLDQVALCAAERRDWETAERCFAASGEIFRLVDDRDGEAGAFAQRGDLARQRGDLEAAHRFLEQSESIEREIGDTRGHPRRRMQRGRLAWAENRLAEARQFFERALSGSDEVKELTGVLHAVLALACLDAPRQPSRAATLLGFEEARRVKSGLSLPSDWHAPRQRTLEVLRAALSEADLQSMISRGASLTLEEAVELAFCAAHDAD